MKRLDMKVAKAAEQLHIIAPELCRNGVIQPEGQPPFVGIINAKDMMNVGERRQPALV